MTGTPPANAYPRGLHAVYGGRIVRVPKTIERMPANSWCGP